MEMQGLASSATDAHPVGRLSDEAYSSIREMVLTGVLPPGALVRESALTEQLGMSRTPVREALRQLQAEGLIASIPHRGYVVIDMTEDELQDVYRVREVLEALGARLAAAPARIRRTDIAALEDLVDDMDMALKAEDDAALARLNFQFHAAVAQASRNTYLQDSLKDIAQVFQRYRPTALGSGVRKYEAHEQHKALVEAIKQGDEDQAAQIAANHVRDALALRLQSSEEGKLGTSNPEA